MKLDPLSPTLITDWASAALGRPIHPAVIHHLRVWLNKKDQKDESAQTRLHHVLVPDMVVLRQPFRNRNQFYFSYKGGRLYDAGAIDPSVKHARKEERINQHLRTYKLYLDNHSIQGIEKEKFDNPMVIDIFSNKNGFTARNNDGHNYNRKARDFTNLSIIQFNNHTKHYLDLGKFDHTKIENSRYFLQSALRSRLRQKDRETLGPRLNL
jgi:hypothetical protein